MAVGLTIGYSTDGDRWHKARSPVPGYLQAVAWNGERYAAVGQRGLIMHSDDGDRWELAEDSGTEESLNDVAWNGERFVAVGWGGSDRLGTVVHRRRRGPLGAGGRPTST